VRRRLLIALAVLAVLAAGLAWLAWSPTGLALVWSQARPYLPASLRGAEVGGRLVGPIRIRHLRLEAGGYRVAVDRARLDWRPLELLGGDLVLDYVHAEGIRVTRAETTPAPAGGEAARALPPEWAPPVAVHLRDLDLRDGALRTAPGAEPVRLERLRARLAVTASAVSVTDLHLRAPALDADGRAGLTPDGSFPVDAELGWTLRLPGRPPLSGHTRLDGGLRDTLRLTQNMAPPLPLRLEARVQDPLTDPRWHLTAGAEAVDLAALGDDLPAVHGGFRLQAGGTAAAAEGRLTLQGRHPEVGPFHAAADWRADPAAATLTLRHAEAGAGDVPGRVTAAGGIALGDGTVRLDLAGDWADLRWPFTGEARWRSASGRWRLAGTPADLHAEVQGQVNQTGRLAASLAYRADHLAADLHWRDLRWPDPALALRSASGSLAVSGTPADYRFRLDAGLARGDEGGRIRADGRGDLDGLTLERLRAGVLGGTVTGEGELAWADTPRAHLALAAKGLDPGRWWPRWPGRLGGRIRVHGAVSDTGPEATVETLRVDGRLRDHDVRLQGGAAYAGGELRLDGLELAAGDTTAAVSGRIGKALDLDWRLDSPDLAVLHPDLAGRLTARGHLGGAPAQPAVAAEARGSDLAYAGWRAGGLSLDADVDLSGARPSRLELTVGKAVVADHTLESLHLSASGTTAEHGVRLQADSELGSAEAAVTGHWQEEQGRWTFRLTSARLAPAGLPEQWRLQAPATGAVGAGHATLEQACFAAGEPRLCLAAARDGDSLRGSFRAAALPLGYLLPLLPAGTGLEGTAGGSGELAWTPAAGLRGRAELTIGPGRLLRVAEGEQAQTVTELGPSRLHLEATPQAIRADSELDLGGGDRITASARLAQDAGPLAQAPLSGRLQGTVADLGFVPLLVPEVTAIDGRAEADLTLGGRLDRPAWDGRLRLRADQLQLASPGITLREVVLAAEPAGGGTLDLSGSARSGGGTLNLQGSARLGAGERRLQARLWGKDFLAYDTVQARVWLSPELSLGLDGRTLTVDGTVRVPRADIALKDLPAEGAVAVSPDQVIVHPEGEGEGAAAPWRIRSRVRVVMGDRVAFQGFGLTSRIAGDLTVVDEPGRPTTASGELRTVAGEYRAYGQRLTIETGKLLFGGGPITDPGLDVRAVRRPRQDILVGVHAHGPLRQPTFELFSEPAMAQAEQLSWLVLGRPLGETSGGEHAALSRAAVVLGMKGGQYLAETFGNDLGLDEVGVETQSGASGDEAALVLGKYLSPRLYVSYGIGLFETVNTLRMQYTLSDHWRLVTESSAVQTGGDLFYTIETGQ